MLRFRLFPRRPMMLLLGLLGVWLAATVTLWLAQDRLVFVGRGFGTGRPVDRVRGVETLWLTTAADGPAGAFRFRAALAQPATPRGFVVCFGGNGEDLRRGVYEANDWARYGLGALWVEFPGYGDSESEPNEATLLAAARAAAGEARRRAEACGGVPVAAAGNSLGTFCAVALAADGLADRIVLRAPPSSIADVGQSRFPLLPVRWLLRHPLDSAALARRVRVPVLVLHGDADRVVPLRFGRRLADAFAGPAELVVVPGAGHDDLGIDAGGPLGERLRAFLVADVGTAAEDR
ncbi:MAG: alpha/beta hydrolase [Planctomycetes bacterium]|nr:alpha/beta hydrolase [Planctomycetota bacterium]